MENKLISRPDARAKGLLYYYTGVPCLRGHDSERLVTDCACIECRKLQKRKYYARDKEAFVERPSRAKRVNHGRPIQQLPALVRIAFDVVKMQPGSPDVQEQMGCERGAAQYFPRRAYLSEQTEHMRIYPLDRETHRRIIQRVVKLHPAPVVKLTTDEYEALIERQRVNGARHRGRPPRPSPRTFALEHNEPYYRSEQPCARGHAGFRHTKSGECKECREIRYAEQLIERRKPSNEAHANFL